jgi:hypothetical protein
MRILHFLPQTDAAIGQYFSILADNMGLEVENHKARTIDEARQLLRNIQFDILHVHGCWDNAQFSIVRRALKLGARLVVTPYGQLQPWEQQRDFWKEKLPKRIAYQQSVVRQAYAVIVQGNMELEYVQQLGWNKRCVIIRNPLITNTITPRETARQTFDVYQRIMDSNPLQLMNDNSLKFVKRLITIGITGDERWLTGEEVPMLGDWRQILCYAHQEQIMPTILRAIRILNLMAPDIDPATIPYFLPDGYKEASTIQQAIGNQFVSENDRLIATFKFIKKLIASRQLSIKHLVELDIELRNHPCDEARLAEQLHERGLIKMAGRIMQLMNDYTGLTEGFMPVPSLDDRITKKYYELIQNHLTI